MRITSVNIPKDHPPADGLDAIHMDGLGQVVLLAGPNGSGKTRLFRKLEHIMARHHVVQKIEAAERELPSVEGKIKGVFDDIAKLHADMNTAVNARDLEQQLRTLENRRVALLGQKTKHEQLLESVVFKFSGGNGRPQIVNFIPKELKLADPFNLNTHDLVQNANAANALGVSRLHDSALPKIQITQNRAWEAKLPESTFLEEDRSRALEEYEQLRSVITALLGIGVERDGNTSMATIFGFRLGDSNLSDGQKVLLQLAVAIHCQGAKLDETVLFLDEPENHLHPKVIIDVVETLIEKIPNGQIWIATHSVSLLAHFHKHDNLWYLDKGKVSKTGKIQKTVLDGLLGDEERVRRQMDFLEEPVQAALVRYAADCLRPPTPVSTSADDPQMKQIREIINPLYDNHRPLTILDYGAGKGRLLAALAADFDADEFRTKVDYIAMDRSLDCREACEAQIARIYGNSQDRWFGDVVSLLDKRNPESVHLVVMCNVLHETDPGDWCRLFGPDGDIYKLLTPGGHLLIVEDQRIPRGEKAHRFGFIVLDTESLKELFLVRGDEKIVVAVDDSRGKGRLKAHLLPREYLARCTKETKQEALKQHKQRAKDAIERIRKDPGESDGRLFAFWIHQFANASLALGE